MLNFKKIYLAVSKLFADIFKYTKMCTKVLWVEIAFQKPSFSTDNGRISRIFFIVFPTKKTSSQNISITLLKIFLKLHEHRGGYWKKELPWTTLSFRCYDNSDVIPTDHNKFSSVSNTIVVAFFPIFFFLRDIVYAQTWEVLTMKTVSSHLMQSLPRSRF